MKIVRPITVTDTVLSASNIAETDYSAYSGATTYALGDRVRVVSTNVHNIYESLQAGNLNHDPTLAASSTWWVKVGSTNRWRMFDSSIGQQSSNADSIDITLVPGTRIDSLGLLNISASSLQVTATSAADGVVYDQTFSLIGTSGITDWWSYFFEPIVRKGDYYVGGIPAYADLSLRVRLNDTGNTVLLGEAVMGLSRNLGDTQYGAALGIQDYSIKQQDAYGNYSVLQRAFRKRGTFSLWMNAGIADEVARLLAVYRATPILYVGTDTYASTLIYGFYKNFTVTIAYPSASLCALEVEGLT